MPSELPDPRALALDRGDALLLLVDVQDELARAMPKDGMARLTKNASVLLKAARRLGLPVVASEQYKKGLGDTVPELRELLAAAPVEKLEFSCGASKPVAREIVQTGRKQVIVACMEVHLCGLQNVWLLLCGMSIAWLPY